MESDGYCEIFLDSIMRLYFMEGWNLHGVVNSDPTKVTKPHTLTPLPSPTRQTSPKTTSQWFNAGTLTWPISAQ
jgi:hypothetical protein